jgi:uncharacterized membrane protein
MTHDRPRQRRRARLWPALRARPRLLASILIGLGVYLAAALLLSLPLAVSTLVAWNTGALLDLFLTGHMAWRTDADSIKRHALEMDEGRLTILVVVVFAASAVLLAVGTQLSQVKLLHGLPRAAHLLLAILTVLTSWFITQTVFAIHYAHEFYTARIRHAPDPLAFPGTTEPGYMDFFHFSCVIGTSAQTADINFNGSALRPVGTLHCIVSFFFNASLLALSINVVAGVLL